MNDKVRASDIGEGAGRPKPAESFKELLAQWRQAGGDPKGPVREVFGWAADELEALLRKLKIEQE